jgi:hypothetical protein
MGTENRAASTLTVQTEDAATIAPVINRLLVPEGSLTQVGHDGARLDFTAGVIFNVKLFGAKGDGATDDTAAIQAAIDFLNTNNISGTIFFPVGIYIVAGSLQDTSNSNSQLILPRRTSAMLSIRLMGPTPVPTIAFKRASQGAVIKSTLTSGTGSIIGGKVGSGAGWPVAGTSWCSVTLENLVVRAIANPTLSGVDFTYIPNNKIINCQISTNEDVISAIGSPPTYGITEPTTTSSYGLKLPPNNIPDQCILDNVQIYGFYTGLLAGELCNIDNTLVVFCKVGVEIPTALHAMRFGRIYLSDCTTLVKFTGGNSYVDMQQLDIEHSAASPAWAAVVTDIDDPNNYGHGVVRWHISDNGAVGFTLVQNGAFYLWTESLGNVTANHCSSPMVQVHNSGNISIANNTLPSAGVGNVTFDTDLSDDPFLMHSTSSNTDRLVPTKEGIATIKFHGVFAAHATGSRQVRIYKHAAAGAEVLLALNNYLPVSGSVDKSVEATVTSRATAPGDYFYIVVFQDSGGSLNLLTGNYYTPIATLQISR